MPSKPIKSLEPRAKKPDIFDALEIDDDDLKILKLFQESPEITHSEIAKELNKSQPAIGARVMKLERKHLLATQKGVNFKTNKEKLYLVIVNLETKDPTSILESELPNCPFMINVLKTSGQRNLVVWLAAGNMQKLESIIDRHFRSNPDVISVETSFVVDVMKNFIFPVNWEFLKYDDIPCGDICCQKVNKRLDNVQEHVDGQGENDLHEIGEDGSRDAI